METTVMIGEKPKVASRIANALGNYDVEENRGVKNYVIETDERKVIIAPAVGHIFNLDQVSEGWDYPVFDVEWKPIFETEDGSGYVKKYYNNLKDQIERADSYINACDFDLEGCLHKDEQVIVKRDDEIRVSRAGRLIDDLIDDGEVKKDGGFEYVEPDLKIMGMDDWKTGFQDIEKAMRRPSEDTYIEITCFNNRAVKVSKNHPLLVATENGLEARKADQIQAGDQVLATKQIPYNEKKKELDLIESLDGIYVHGFKDRMEIMPAEMCEHVDKTRKQCLNYRHHDRMPKEIFLELEDKLGVGRESLEISTQKGSTRLPARLKLDERLGRIIGLYLAEGCIDSGGFIGFYFGPEEDDLAEEVQKFLQEIGTEGKKRKREIEAAYGDSKCFEVGTKSGILRKLLLHLDIGQDSGSKNLPEWILSGPEEFKQGIISGYWAGDGSLFVDEKDNRAVASVGSKNKALLESLFYLLQTRGINPSFQDWAHSDRQMTNMTVGRSQDVRELAEILDTGTEFQESLENTSRNSRYSPMSKVPVQLAQRQEVRTEKKGQIKASDSIDNSHILEWEEGMENYPEGDVAFLKVRKTEEKNYEAEYFYDFQTSTRNYQHGHGIVSHNSVIGYNVIHQIADPDEERIQRMKFSTLTPSDLQDAFDSLEDFDHGMTEAGITRHIMDYYYGINVSRALMKAVRKNDRYQTLSTGRVQGPALKVLADREREIQEFEPDPYWEIFLHHPELQAKWEDEEDRIWEEGTAESVFAEVEDEDRAVVSNIKVNNYKHNPPVPFNLTGLQSEASSQFGISPKQTQSIAQSLYESGLISYPRTESQKLPAKIGYKNLLKKLKGQKAYDELAEKVLDKDDIYPRQGGKEDDAHPAIYPTGESPGGKLNKQEKKIYDLVVKRFFAVFGDAAKRQSLTLTLEVNDNDFKAKSKVTKERNWFDLYDPYVRVEEAELPELEEGEVLDVDEFELVEKETQPPNRYSQSGIVSELEKKELGTKATRAQIVDRLYNRDFIESDPIEVTDLGLAVVETLEKHCADVISEDLTRRFEEKMQAIRNEEETRESVLEEAREELSEILSTFKAQEQEIGAELVETIDAEREKQRQLGPCDQCEDGTLRIVKANGNRFVGCSNYPDCENTYPLPRQGDINSTNEICDECNTPKIWVNRKKKKSYNMCIDPDCPTKDDW